MKIDEFRPVFVEFIPKELAEGVLYVSMNYATVRHLCACGCGTQVVTPLSPPKWTLTFDGDTVSLCPSIGNWQFPCRSHYWIQRNKVKWSRQWSNEEIAEARRRDADDMKMYQRGEWQPTPKPTQPVAASRRGLVRWLTDVIPVPLRKR